MAAAGVSCWTRTLLWNQRHLMMVLRKYEDFYNSTGRTAPWARPRHCGRCQMTSPTWIIPKSGGMTARVASSTNIAWWHRFSAPTGRAAAGGGGLVGDQVALAEHDRLAVQEPDRLDHVHMLADDRGDMGDRVSLRASCS